MTETVFLILDGSDAEPPLFGGVPRRADGSFTVTRGAHSLHVYRRSTLDYLALEDVDDVRNLILSMIAGFTDPAVYQLEFRASGLLDDCVASIPRGQTFFVENVHSLFLDRAMIDEARHMGVPWPFCRPAEVVPAAPCAGG